MATKRWQSGAQSVTDVWTLTLSGTVTSQTYTVTIGNKTITYVANGSATVAIIMAALLASWNSTTTPAAPEFKELTATGGVTDLVLTGKLTGRPHVITFTTGGVGVPVATNTTAATGPNHIDNGANWSGGVAPANTDLLIFDSGTAPCKYGFSTMSAMTTITVQVNPGYGGRQIGLPGVNRDAGVYYEYRTPGITIEGGTAIVNCDSLSLFRINFGTTLAVVRSLQTGQRLDPNYPIILLRGGAASSTLDISRGDVGLAFFAGETANFPVWKMGYVTNQATDARLVIGLGTTWTTGTKNGGYLENNASGTTLTQNQNGGVTTNLTGAFTTINVNGGVFNQNATGTAGTINVRNEGLLDFDGDTRAKTVTNPITVTGKQARVRDNQKAVNSGVLTLTLTDALLSQVEHGTSNGVVAT